MGLQAARFSTQEGVSVGYLSFITDLFWACLEAVLGFCLSFKSPLKAPLKPLQSSLQYKLSEPPVCYTVLKEWGDCVSKHLPTEIALEGKAFTPGSEKVDPLGSVEGPQQVLSPPL